MDKLIALAEKYKKHRHSNDLVHASLLELYNKFIREKEQTLIDSISASGAVSAIFLTDQIDFSEITPQMEEAFKLAYPNVDISFLVDRNPEEIEGFINAWKGKLFEVVVRDNLNAGEWVGDIHLQSGQYALLAESATQPGWDLQIIDDAGDLVSELQLKATQSLSYVKAALERYPDIDILTTDEVFESASEITGHILNSGLSEEDLADTIQAPLESLIDTGLEEIFEDILPFLPFVIVTIGEGRKVLMGKKTFQVAFSDSLFRYAKTGAAMGVGAIVALLDGGILSIPATMLTRISFDRYKLLKNLNAELADKIITIKQISLNYETH